MTGSDQKGDCSVIESSWGSIILVLRYRLLICFGQINPFIFLFSERRSFPQLESKRMPRGRKLWQGALHPYNNLEHSNLWFHLIKQKKVKKYWHIFLGLKSIMLNLAAWTTRKYSIPQNVTLLSDLKIATAVVIHISNNIKKNCTSSFIKLVENTLFI